MAYPLIQTTTFLLLGASLALAAPLSFFPRQVFTALGADQISTFRPFTFYASAAYCPSSQTRFWTCGANCDANPNFQPIASGGDGAGVQFWYVGFDPELSTLIVAHQGTDPTKIESLLTDADFFLDNLDPVIFPGISDDIQVHNGFAEAHAETAKDVLAAVKQGMQVHNTNKITVVGHSLGAAISVLDAVSLPMQIPGLELNFIGYGMPRVGNQEFADFVDQHVKIQRITNQNDPVPILPGRFLGFHHPGGEIHINKGGQFIQCPGADNTDKRCSTGDVRNILLSDVGDHSGPYGDVRIGCDD